MAIKKVAEVTINVPYKSAGNVIRQKEVGFEVYQDTGRYHIKPLLSEAERRLANLPENLDFMLLDGKAVSSKGVKDGNLHVITDVVNQLKVHHLIK